jgi:hypothetical protein
VLGVVRLAELAGGDEEAGRPQPQPAPLEARDDLTGEAALDGVRLGEDEGALDGQGRDSTLWAYPCFGWFAPGGPQGAS